MGGYAWVTLATNDSYSLGALVLANSLRRVGTVHQLAVLITPGVTNSMREKLSSVFNVVKEVNILDSKDQNNLRLLQRPELGITFTKLNCWRLTQFDKCVFLDADTLLLQNADELFEREEFSAAPDVGWPDCFNSGVYVYKPSEDTYENLVKFALQTGSFDGADQGLLNLYFNEWAHKDISKHLPFIYNVCSTATYSYMPAFKQFSRNIKIIHFIGNTKPWLQHFDFETRNVQTTPGLEHLHGIIQQWWEIFCSSVHPVLSQQMAGLAGAFAQLTLGCPSTVEQRILEDNLRRQNWESGNIDYMGRDAFDNIWTKICDTLSTPETTATQEKEQSLPAATIPENLSEREVSSKLSQEEKPQESIPAPIIDATSAIKVEPNIAVIASPDKPISSEDSSKITETKIPTDVVPPTQESVPTAPLVSETTQPAAQIKPSVPETTVDTSSIVVEESKIPEVVKVGETQPAKVEEKKCEKSIEESKEPPLATDSSQKQTEAIPSQVAVALPPADVVISETTSQSSPAPIIESVKIEEKPSDVVSEKPSVPISEPSPQTKELETKPALPSTCPLTESSQVEATKATTTPQQTDAPKPQETQKSASPSECSLKKSPEVEPAKVAITESESSKPQQTPKSPPPTECSAKKSPEVEPAKVEIKGTETSKPQQTKKSPPPTECSAKKSQEVEIKKTETSKPQQTKKSPPPSESSAKKSPEVEPAKVVIKETETSKPQQTKKSPPPTERSAKKSPEGKPAQVVSKESGIPKPQETPKSPPPTESSVKKTPEVETAKGQEVKGSGTTKPQETQKLPQGDATKTAKSASTAQQQPKEAGAPKPESQKVEPEKEPKPSPKAQSSEAAAVSGSQQGPAPPPRKSGGTKKASGKSKK